MAKTNEQAPEKEVKSAKVSDKKVKKQNKNPGFFARIGRKLKETFSELKRVTWPTFGKALKSTGIVLGVVLIFLVLVTGVNFGFNKLLEILTELGVQG